MGSLPFEVYLHVVSILEIGPSNPLIVLTSLVIASVEVVEFIAWVLGGTFSLSSLIATSILFVTMCMSPIIASFIVLVRLEKSTFVAFTWWWIDWSMYLLVSSATFQVLHWNLFLNYHIFYPLHRLFSNYIFLVQNCGCSWWFSCPSLPIVDQNIPYWLSWLISVNHWLPSTHLWEVVLGRTRDSQRLVPFIWYLVFGLVHI